MKIRGVISQLVREGDAPARAVVHLRSDQAVGEFSVPLTQEVYDNLCKNFVGGPIEVSVHVVFDKQTTS